MSLTQTQKWLRREGIPEADYRAAQVEVRARGGWDLGFVLRRGFRLFRVCPRVPKGGPSTETCHLGMGTLAKLVADPHEWLASWGL